MAAVFAVSGGERTKRAIRPAARRAMTGWAFTGPATATVIALALLPAVWSFLISRTRWKGFGRPAGIGWGNYEWLAQNARAHAAAGHTLVFAAMFVPASVVLGMGVAIALNRRIRLIGFYRLCVVVPFVASETATGFLAAFVFHPQFGAVNALLRLAGLPEQQFLQSPAQALTTLCVIALWGEIGFTAVIYLAALQDVPRSLIEAAALDGAGRWRVLWHIILPELRAVTLFVVVWQTVTALQLFDLVYTATGGGPAGATTTLAFYLYDLVVNQRHFGRAAALSYLLFALTLAVTLVAVVHGRRTGREVF
jgi:multiple sugar transport system permease protein